MSRAKYVHFLVCKLPNYISTPDSIHNSRLHFYFKIYTLKDISNFRYSNQKIITFFLDVIFIDITLCLHESKVIMVAINKTLLF